MASNIKTSCIVLAALAASLPFLSCRDAGPSGRVLSGNMAYGRGQYQKAILRYLDADDETGIGRDAVNYNLANVYYALGEGDAALKAWAMAESLTDDTDILFRVAFNRGVLYYNWGRYDEAYREFRRALSINPSDIDAKINLEDALSRVRSEIPGEGRGEGGEVENVGEEIDDDSKRLLDYVRRKEADAWSTEESDDGGFAEDW